MKPMAAKAAVLVILGFSAARLTVRWREEKADRRITIMADWTEIRDNAARQNISDQELLERLHHAGFNAILVGAATVQDYLWQDMAFSSRPLAETVLRQLLDRGVTGISLHSSGSAFRLTGSQSRWQRLKDVEVGFNPELLGKASQAGFRLVLRVNNDPWLDKDKLFSNLQAISSANSELAVILNTEDVPGGTAALPSWSSFLETQNFAQLLFEFHPAKSAVKLALRSPRSTFRAHTIPPAELKDLLPGQELSRWRRAVEERSCRFLLLHLSPSDSLAGFLENADAVNQHLTRHGWSVAWPRSHAAWSRASFFERILAPLVGLIAAILVPVMALRANLPEPPWSAFVRIFAMTFIGACVVAAVSQNPWTRLEIIPFRGIKAAFLLAWLGSFGSLYSWKEIEEELSRSVRRLDVVAGLIVAAAFGYLILRTGNAGSGWKAGWEQGVRDRLEEWLIARPRFKEFAIGYPLLLVGLHLKSLKKTKALWLDRRVWIGLGMIGPISMVNTFCHLHSPLYLALWRSINGFLIGAVMGVVLLTLMQQRMARSES